jgi:AraC family transcriptional regulator
MRDSPIRSSITQGERVRVCGAGWFTVVDATYTTARRWDTHSHDEALLSFAPSGEYVERVDGARYTCGPGAYLLKPARTDHANRFDRPDTRCVSIAISKEATEWLPGLRRLFATPRLITGFPARFQPILLAELRRGDELAPLAVQGIVCALLAELARSADSGRPAAFRRACEFIHAQIGLVPAIQEIAVAAGVHAGHLNRLFRRHAGVSTAEYVRRLRVARAARDLAGTRLSIAEIAATHGFYDQSHLTNAFRRYVGSSPADYRRNSRPS